MKFSSLSFIITDDCNFRCSYCFQGKKKIYMKRDTIKKALGFFYPYLAPKSDIVFFGGEPLLAVKKIHYTVAMLGEMNEKENKEFTYSLTTNGSLLDESMLTYFDRFKFSVMLSYDGIAHDQGRQPGSSEKALETIRGIGNYPNIDFCVNSVFNAGTVNQMAASYRQMIEAGAKELILSLDTMSPWTDDDLIMLENQLEELSIYLHQHYRSTGHIPLVSFRPRAQQDTADQAAKKSRFACDAGRHRISVTGDEELWGCYLFHDYMKERKDSEDHAGYYFGTLDSFMADHETIYPQVMENYNDLKQDQFIVDEQFCFLCEDVDVCSVCPVNTAYETGTVGKIHQLVCRQNKIRRAVKQRFLEKLT